MANSFAEMWRQNDLMRARSQAEYDSTAAALEEFKGWRFQGCPDGVIWSATHKTHGRITARSGGGLLTQVKLIEEKAKQKEQAK